MRPIRRLLLSGLPLVLTTRWLAMVGAGLDRKPNGPSIVVLSDGGARAHARSARQRLALPVKLGSPMSPTKPFALAAICICAMFSVTMRADPTPAERVAEIQKALQAANLDGWLFYDFRGSDPLAARILKLGEHASGSRRWFYYIPAGGEPTKIVHSIERGKLDALPGRRVVYRGWEEQHALIASAIQGPAEKRPRHSVTKRVAMQYSPNNDIPYIS